MTISVPTDLIDAAKRGDEQALAELYTAHFDRVYSYLRVALNDAAEAEEATQEIFMKVLRCLDRYQQGKEPFGEWLLAIARSHVVACLRKRSVPAGGAVSPAGETGAATLLTGPEEMLRALRSASDDELLLLLARLPEAQRQAVVLGYVLDFGPRETARVLGLTQKATRELQAHGLASLGRRLEAVGREPAQGRLAMRRHRPREGALKPSHSISVLR